MHTRAVVVALAVVGIGAAMGSGVALAIGGAPGVATRTATTCPPNPDGSHPPCPPPMAPPDPTAPICDGIVDGVFTSVPCGAPALPEPPPPAAPAEPLAAPPGFTPRFAG